MCIREHSPDLDRSVNGDMSVYLFVFPLVSCTAGATLFGVHNFNLNVVISYTTSQEAAEIFAALHLYC